MGPTAGQNPRVRLLAAGKMLFARLGYEQTSTSAIAREARTSESQLVRHFDGKRGLLTAILDENWRLLNEHIANTVDETANAHAAILAVFSIVVDAFDRDQELSYLFLFEDRRIRAAGRDLELSSGYLDFTKFLCHLIRRAQRAGTLPSDLDDAALCSALIGAAEGMIRDRLIAEGAGHSRPFSRQQIRRVFAALLEGVRRRPSSLDDRSETAADRRRARAYPNRRISG